MDTPNGREISCTTTLGGDNAFLWDQGAKRSGVEGSDFSFTEQTGGQFSPTGPGASASTTR